MLWQDLKQDIHARKPTNVCWVRQVERGDTEGTNNNVFVHHDVSSWTSSYASLGDIAPTLL